MVAVSAPTVTENTDYYLVSGNTANEIRNDLNMNTVVWEGGISFDARTDWFVKWNFWWNESNSLCTITRVKTSVNVNYTLPKLINARDLPASLQQKWDTYMIALSGHENGHRDMGISAASEIENEIGNMPPRRTCTQLESDANSLANQIIEKFQFIEIEFDRKTNHGANDGAMFP